MNVKLIKTCGDWRDVLDVARVSMGKDSDDREPTNKWKKQILLSGHTPVREIEYIFIVKEIPYWIVMHFVRHHEGITHTVSTQRTDRTGIDRDKLPQDALVTWRFRLNANALMTISRARLCASAGEDVAGVWGAIISEIERIDPVLYSVLVPECIYRGTCYEFLNPCGYSETKEFENALDEYRRVL